MRLLFDLADIAEDLFFFGMKPPEIPPRAFLDAQRKAATRIAPVADAGDELSFIEAGARRSPGGDPRSAETCDLMWQSVRLVLMGRRLARLDNPIARRLGGMLDERAARIFESYCSLTPRWLICQWLLGDPPPPPHWEMTILHAISFVDAGARIGGEGGAGLEAAGAAIIDQLLAGPDAGARLA